MLSDAAKTRAFTVTRLATEQLRAVAQRQLQAALERGETMVDFAAALASEEASLGVTPSNAAYVENVYRTGIQSSYGAGRLRQITSPAVKAARGFVEYRTAGDSRVRPSHAKLNGVIFSQDDPGWQRFAAPNGFQCRCSVVTRRDAGGRKVTLAADIPADAQPDPGFNAPPTVTLAV